MALRDILALVLGIAALLWYFICLFSIGTAPLPTGTTPDDFRGFMSLSLTTIGASLATFIGMLLGIKQVGDVVRAEKSTPDQTGQQTTGGVQMQRLTAGALTTNLQWVAAALYVISLGIALWFWHLHGDKTDPAVTNLGKTLLGLLGGALVIVLNLPPKQ